MTQITILFLVTGTALSIASRNFVERCLGLKLAGDALAILILNFAEPKSEGDIRILSLSIMSITTVLIFLLFIIGKRYYSEPSDAN